MPLNEEIDGRNTRGALYTITAYGMLKACIASMIVFAQTSNTSA